MTSRIQITRKITLVVQAVFAAALLGMLILGVIARRSRLKNKGK